MIMTGKREDQLPLAVGLEDEAHFDNFVTSLENLQLVTWLQDPEKLDSPVLIWGPPASGRTHLLQACCHLAGDSGAFFLPLRYKDQLQPEILEGVGGLSMICIDDLQHAAGDPEWELALVRLINAVNPTDSHLVLSASAKAADLDWDLPDLRSRLQQALVFRLHPLNDEGIMQAFELRARNRGLNLAAGVTDFIGVRAERRLDALMEILERLDESSMQRQHRITIPLVKEILGW